MAAHTVYHATIHVPSTPREVLVCPGRTDARATAKPGESTITINGVCYTQADLHEEIRLLLEKLHKSERAKK